MASRRARWALAGVVAGVVFGVVQTLFWALAGSPPSPRMFASVISGPHAFAMPLAAAAALGVLAHVAISAGWGLVHGAIARRASLQTRRSFDTQIVGGLLFGSLVWLIDHQVLARALFPWFLEQGWQVAEWLIHSACYGLPLGILSAADARRALRVVPGELRLAPAVRPRRDRTRYRLV